MCFTYSTNILILFYFFTVISHQYGAVGAEPKNLDLKSIIIDFELLQEFSNPEFRKTLKTSLSNFIKTIKAAQLHSGIFSKAKHK